MILFVDGMDGTGKTTLVAELLHRLVERGCPALEAPPLWTFLSPITTPDDFPDWVQQTPGIDVGRHLLAAMSQRLDKLQADRRLGIIDPNAVVLVDRGPRTVLSSARSHAATGRRSGQHDQTLLAHQELDEKIARLATTDHPASVFLTIDGGPEVAIRRLNQIQQLTPDYLHYLRLLHQEITSLAAWPCLPEQRVQATNDPTTIAADVLNWISDRGPTPNQADESPA